MMIDAEVLRLRRLRNRALQVRAVARILGRDRTPPNRPLAVSALISWRVARVVTGRLRAHPNLRYQKGPGRLRCWFNHAAAFLITATARGREGGLHAYAARLQCLLRDLDDTRALTWDPHLSDTLGRAQMQMRRLLQELAGTQQAAAPAVMPRIDTPSTNGRTLGDVAIATDWPYLAI